MTNDYPSTAQLELEEIKDDLTAELRSENIREELS